MPLLLNGNKFFSRRRTLQKGTCFVDPEFFPQFRTWNSLEIGSEKIWFPMSFDRNILKVSFDDSLLEVEIDRSHTWMKASTSHLMVSLLRPQARAPLWSSLLPLQNSVKMLLGLSKLPRQDGLFPKELKGLVLQVDYRESTDFPGLSVTREWSETLRL